jgi:transposase
MAQIWAGVDVGKTHHHCAVIDADGRRLLSRRVANDESELLGLLGEVAELGDEITWAVDLPDGGAALLIGLLVAHNQRLLYIPGRTIHRAAAGYRGEGKTDARDAAIIADQARMRRDLAPLRPGDEITVELKILTTRRADLVADRTRTVNRLRGLLTGIFPALEQALDLTTTGPLVMLTGYQTPAALRRIGTTRLETWLRNRKVRNADKLAIAAVEAAGRQHTTLPGETLTATIVATVAREVMALTEQIHQLDTLIEDRFHQHELAEVIISLPGLGTLLGAEFLAATGGDMTAFGTPDRLAGFAGLAPAPPALPPRPQPRLLLLGDDQHRPLPRIPQVLRPQTRRGQAPHPGRPRPRTPGEYGQSAPTLARRRVNVLWALLPDKRPYQPTAPAAAAA